jgi:hypothetical protein
MPNEPNDQITRDEEIAEKLYEPAPRVRVAKDAPLEQRMYGHSALLGVIDSKAKDLWNEAGADTAARQQERDLWLGLANATNLPEGVLMRIAEGSINNRLAKSRVVEDEDAAEVALDRQIVAWNKETRDQLSQTYGAEQGEQLLKRAARFVAKHPKLAERMRERGLGSRPDIVLGIIEHIFETGWR